jgi:hypothetical protein
MAMKRFGLISDIVVPLVLLGFFISCDNAGGLSGYYIYAVIGGTEYEWKLGLTIFEDDAYGSVITIGDPDRTFLFATPYVETGDFAPDNHAWIVFEGATTGTYSISDVSQAYYDINDVRWDFTDITLVVTTFEDIGGVISGTFSGTVEDEGSNTMTVENGQFNVIRITDNTTPG